MDKEKFEAYLLKIWDCYGPQDKIAGDILNALTCASERVDFTIFELAYALLYDLGFEDYQNIDEFDGFEMVYAEIDDFGDDKRTILDLVGELEWYYAARCGHLDQSDYAVKWRFYATDLANVLLPRSPTFLALRPPGI